MTQQCNKVATYIRAVAAIDQVCMGRCSAQAVSSETEFRYADASGEEEEAFRCSLACSDSNNDVAES